MGRTVFFVLSISCVFLSLDVFPNAHACNKMPVPAGVPAVVPPTLNDRRKRCLHVDAPVLMDDGKSVKKAGDLVVGDHVWGENGLSTPVVLTPVADVDVVQTFVHFETENGYGTTLTPDHAVFSRPCGEPSVTQWPIKRSIDLIVGECVPTIDGEGKVVAVQSMELVGRVQPITENGKLVVGGVYVSCYDYSHKNDTQEERHATYEPARIFYSWAEKIYNALSNEEYALGVIDSVIRGTGLEKLYYK